MKKEPVSRTIYYESSEKLLPKWNKWIDKNAVSHTFADGKGEIVLKDSVTELGECAFEYAKEIGEGEIKLCNEVLTSVVIPDSVTKIGEKAFMECSGLTAVYIPDSVKKIGKKAFFKCILQSISVPESTEIGEEAFDYCERLPKIRQAGQNKAL